MVSSHNRGSNAASEPMKRIAFCLVVLLTPALAQQADCGADCGGTIQYASPLHLRPVFEYADRKPPRYVTAPDGKGWFIIERADGRRP